MQDKPSKPNKPNKQDKSSKPAGPAKLDKNKLAKKAPDKATMASKLQHDNRVVISVRDLPRALELIKQVKLPDSPSLDKAIADYNELVDRINYLVGIDRSSIDAAVALLVAKHKYGECRILDRLHRVEECIREQNYNWMSHYVEVACEEGSPELKKLVYGSNSEPNLDLDDHLALKNNQNKPDQETQSSDQLFVLLDDPDQEDPDVIKEPTKESNLVSNRNDPDRYSLNGLKGLGINFPTSESGKPKQVDPGLDDITQMVLCIEALTTEMIERARVMRNDIMFYTSL